MLAVLMVTNNAEDGVGSLNYAITSSTGRTNGGTGDDVIQFAPELDGPRAGRHLAVAPSELARMVVIELVAATLRGKAQDEAGIAVDIDRFDRIHLDGNSK